MTRNLIFTDLDGTFLDFDNYQPGPALERAKRLISSGDKVIFCSSKTYTEQWELMLSFDLIVPAIVENGSGFFIPEEFRELSHLDGMAVEGGKLIGWGKSRDEILKVLKLAERKLGLTLNGYATLSLKEIAGLTGLSIEGAYRANHRFFSETITRALSDSNLNRLNQFLETYQLVAVCGGRFHTITSMHTDKGIALRKVVEAMNKCTGQDWQSIAIGDSANDFPMFREADRAILLGDYTSTDLKGIPQLERRSQRGPEGWIV